MRILVTGGTGFIGSNLVIELLRQGHEVLITGHDAEQKISGFKGKYLQPSFLGLDWDALGKIDVLFHQAAINDTTSADRREMLRANFESSQELFKRIADAGCRRFIYASSTAVYGNGPVPYKENQLLQPLNPYAESKALFDEWAKEFAAKNPELIVVGLRYCNVYGPGENHKGKRASMIYQLAQQISKGNPRLFKYGEQKRDYLYIKDAVSANLLALNAAEGGIYNIASGQTTSFNDVIKILSETTGIQRKTEYIDNPQPAQYQNHTECDISLVKEKLGFAPEFDIKTGIENYYQSGFLLD